jgi:hypothetical protein
MFERQYTAAYTVTRRPEDRQPLAVEVRPPQPRAFEREVLDALLEDDAALEAACAQASALPAWDRHDVARWRQERAALEAATAALEPAPITARGVARGLLRAVIAVPMIIIAEARRG